MTRQIPWTSALMLIVTTTAGCLCAPRIDVPTATAPLPTLASPLTTPTAQATAASQLATTAPVPPTTDTTLPTTATTLPAAETGLPTVAPTNAPNTNYLGLKKQGGALGGTWTLTDARVGAHEDRFRLVIEVQESRDHAPFFEAIEVDNAAAPFPTGHDPTWGVARIDLTISDLYLFDFPVGERFPIAAPENPIVTRVSLLPTQSDAHVGFSIGLREPAEYQAYYLEDPIRIVIDVLYP